MCNVLVHKLDNQLILCAIVSVQEVVGGAFPIMIDLEI